MEGLDSPEVNNIDSKEETMTWKRITSGAYDGYISEDGRTEITDNGAGLASSKGNGRWALVIDGQWIRNYDYLKEAKEAS